MLALLTLPCPSLKTGNVVTALFENKNIFSDYKSNTYSVKKYINSENTIK